MSKGREEERGRRRRGGGKSQRREEGEGERSEYVRASKMDGGRIAGRE